MQGEGSLHDEQNNRISEGIDPESELSSSKCKLPSASASLESPASEVEGLETCRAPGQARIGDESPELLPLRLITMESDLDELKKFCSLLQSIVENGVAILQDESSDERRKRILSLADGIRKADLMEKTQRNWLDYYVRPPASALQEHGRPVTSDVFYNLAGGMVKIVEALQKLCKETMEVFEGSIV